jgi:hypothetical protein
MEVRLSALHAGHLLPPRRFLILISVKGLIESRATVRLEGLGQLKSPMTSSAIEPATFRLVAQCLNQLRYRVPQDNFKIRKIVVVTWCCEGRFERSVSVSKMEVINFRSYVTPNKVTAFHFPILKTEALEMLQARS